MAPSGPLGVKLTTAGAEIGAGGAGAVGAGAGGNMYATVASPHDRVIHTTLAQQNAARAQAHQDAVNRAKAEQQARWEKELAQELALQQTMQSYANDHTWV